MKGGFVITKKNIIFELIKTISIWDYLKQSKKSSNIIIQKTELFLMSVLPAKCLICVVAEILKEECNATYDVSMERK